MADGEDTGTAPDGETGETTTRDLSTLTENGPNLTALETPSARAAYTERPSFSPVAQPGMAAEIWYHTVPGQGQMPRYAPPSNGMISRLNGATQTITVDAGGGGGKRKRKKKHDEPEDKESREQEQDERQRGRRRRRR